MATEIRITTTVKVSNISPTAIARDLFSFFESVVGKDAIFACEIFTVHKNWKSGGHGRVQFENLEYKKKAFSLSEQGLLYFSGSYLKLTHSLDEVILRPVEPNLRLKNGVLHTGFLVESNCMSVLESWKDVKTWIMPERKCIELWLNHGGECYRLEVQFDDVIESCECRLSDRDCCAVLLRLKHAPKINRKVSGPHVASRFSTDKYHLCKENFDFSWVRTTDFSSSNSIGLSSCLCLEIGEGISGLDLTCLPFYKNTLTELILESGAQFSTRSELVPLVDCQNDVKLAYEILFQINSLIHTQKISLGAIDNELFQVLGGLDMDTSMKILQQMHKSEDMCYDPVSYIRTQLHVLGESDKNPPSLAYNKLTNSNLMICHRVLITPSKIYCLGPELDTSNYIVKNFAKYASDFLRVTFVEEDWSRLSPYAVYTCYEKGIFAKSHRTDIYHRVLSVLQNGIVIGEKRFLFLAFSASQLRSNAVWMFASNNEVKTEDIRDWMGCFNQIRSVSKCAARMGQLFSTSRQTFEVQPLHVEVIPDIEVNTDGFEYCFSDGIGKISQAFARQVAQKCGLSHTPSAFQIRYGGYKGVIAVDRSSFRKLSLRRSMLKFESNNRMLNITKCCDAMPCYLNREIITLLSTLGVDDQVFLDMQNVQLFKLGRMLTDKKAALDVLDSMGLDETKSVAVKMLKKGYEPNIEPYLSMMLQAHHDNQLSDLRSRCRIFVPKGRVLLGCLDEAGILEYGQVFARITLNKTDLECSEQSIFQKVDETTAILTGKVVVTKNPCLHPGDVRILEAVYEVTLEEKGLVDCIVFPQKGERPHPNECSGGDLDGDLYFISWDKNLIPPQTVKPMDYTGRRPRIMDHEVTLEEIQRFFVDYLVNDTLGFISTAHLIHADREPEKALSAKCLQLATLHSMAVDFAKTGAPAEMPRFLKPREYPDFMERWEKPMYISEGALGKLYRANIAVSGSSKSSFEFSPKIVQDAYDHDLVVAGYESCLQTAENHKYMYLDRLTTLMKYYDADTEDEILTGNLRNKSMYLQRDNRRYFEVRDRIMVAIKNLQKEARGWFEGSCTGVGEQQMASAWYHVTYHSTYAHGSANCLGFPWIVGDILLEMKFSKSRMPVE